jgi:hypothetical protein
MPLVYAKQMLITLALNKNAIFSTENWEKLFKNVIITSTPQHKKSKTFKNGCFCDNFIADIVIINETSWIRKVKLIAVSSAAQLCTN